MISKKRLFSMLVVSVALAIFVAPLCVKAEELWDPHLRGVNEGLDAGALPPTGLYFINNSYFATYAVHDDQGNKVAGTSLSAYVDVPILLWVPGCEFFGATYGVAIAQPFDWTSFGAVDTNGSHDNWGTYNTVLVPAILAWKLPYDLHVAANLSVYVPDAQTTVNDSHLSAGLPSGNGAWALEPGLGISWLHDGWNVSADVHYTYSFKDPHNDNYSSAPEFWVDYTIAKTIGKWTVGLGAYQQNQTGNDHYGTQGGKGIVASHDAQSYGMGPLVGYNFGPVIVEASYDWGLYTKDDVGGDFFNFRMIVPIPLCGM